MNPLLLVDNYKLDHYKMYPEGMTLLYSNFTPRKSRIKGVEHVIVAGVQKFIKEYLIDKFNKDFFGTSCIPYCDESYREVEGDSFKESMLQEYMKHVKLDSYKHIEDLWDLGYLPIEIKALPEGTRCPIGVPLLTIKNTHPDFGWLVNYLETLISTQLWQIITSATIAGEYKANIDKWALITTGTTEGTERMGHDFSMRGMSSVESAILSALGHLFFFNGTDVVPAIYNMERNYHVSNLIASGVPATEHSVMCMGTKESEIETFERLLDLYPTGILSVVSDTWDLWKVCTEYLPALKDKILARDGKLVIRPDSGNPADIICGISSCYQDVSHYFPQGEILPEYFEDLLIEEVREDTPHGEHGPEEYEQKYIVRGELYVAKIHNISWNRHDKQYYYIDMWEEAKITVEKVDIKPSDKGVIELLWDVFGGTVNEQGYKVLDPHIGLIYGDGIGLHNLDEINSRLEAKGFATTNWVAGFGSYGYQYNTRDTFGFAMKATYGEITHNSYNKLAPTSYQPSEFVEAREIFKDPITDDGTKKSKKGLLQVFNNRSDCQGCQQLFDGKDQLTVTDQCTWGQEKGGLLQTVFLDGVLVNGTSFEEIRNRLKNN